MGQDYSNIGEKNPNEILTNQNKLKKNNISWPSWIYFGKVSLTFKNQCKASH